MIPQEPGPPGDGLGTGLSDTIMPTTNKERDDDAKKVIPL